MQRKTLFMALGGVGVVVVGGFLLGAWLSWNAPADLTVVSPNPAPVPRQGSAEAPVAQIDAGVFVPEPPQPRLDGTRGVPRRLVQPTAPVPLVSALDQPPPDTVLSAIMPDPEAILPPYDPATELAPAQQVPRPASQITTVDATSATPAPAVEGWMVALRTDLQRCMSQSAVSRGICQEQAQWKHCSNNNGWGRIPECPATGQN